MSDNPADGAAAQRLSVIAETHARCADARAAEGWLIEGVSVRCRGQWHDVRCRKEEMAAHDCPLRT